MPETHEGIRACLVDALHHPQIEPPPLVPASYKPPKYLMREAPDELKLARRIRYWAYWSEYKGELPQHQRQAIEWRHIRQAYWPTVAHFCEVDEQRAQEYVTHGLEVIVSRIEGVLTEGPEGAP